MLATAVGSGELVFEARARRGAVTDVATPLEARAASAARALVSFVAPEALAWVPRVERRAAITTGSLVEARRSAASALLIVAGTVTLVRASFSASEVVKSFWQPVMEKARTRTAVEAKKRLM
jgi:hypothetical protein